MQKTTGTICFLIGLALLVEGRRIANYFGADVQPIFSGAPTDRAVYIYFCGAVIALLGVAQFFWPVKRK
jgi:Protein of unknown function (DUF3185)